MSFAYCFSFSEISPRLVLSGGDSSGCHGQSRLCRRALPVMMKIAYGVSYLLRQHLLVARTLTFFTLMITVSTRTPAGPASHICTTPGRVLFLPLVWSLAHLVDQHHYGASPSSHTGVTLFLNCFDEISENSGNHCASRRCCHCCPLRFLSRIHIT